MPGESASIQLKSIEDRAHQFPYISGVIRREEIAKAFRSPWKMEQVDRFEVAEDLQEDVQWRFCKELRMAPDLFPVILLTTRNTICSLSPLSLSLLGLWMFYWGWCCCCRFGCSKTRRFAGGHCGIEVDSDQRKESSRYALFVCDQLNVRNKVSGGPICPARSAQLAALLEHVDFQAMSVGCTLRDKSARPHLSLVLASF